MATIPGASSLTIGNTGAVAPGNYNLTVTASHSGGPSQNLPLSLRVFNQAPGTPTLTAPANAATNVEVNPVLTWTASTQGDEYVVEIAADAGFTNIVYTRTLTGTSHTVQTALTRTSQYHWRVRPTNPCASGVASSTFTFTTQDFFCVSPNLAIPDNITVESEQSIATPGVVADLNVSVVITHPNLSDLVLSLRNQDTGTEVALISQSCDFRQNIDAVFDDEAPIPITCSVSVPGLMGTQQPLEALSAFDTQALNSRWRLVAADTQFGSTGTDVARDVVFDPRGKVYLVGNVAAEFEGRRLARFAPHGRAIADWIAPLFAGESPADSRVRLAASLLSDVAWSANPDFRAERGAEIGLHGNWRSIDIPGRVLLARALYAGFGGADAEFPAMGALVSPDRLARARQWGLAIRLAQRLTGGVEAPLKASGIALVDGKLRLCLDAGWHHLAGESVERRLRLLAQALDAKPELVLL